MGDDNFISFSRPSIGAEEIAEVIDTLKSGWLTTGAKTARFERDFAAYVRTPFALATNSCTASLHLALTALGVGPGDEVITTPMTFCATVNSIVHCGATPVLADIGSDGNIDPVEIEARVTPRTRAIIPVHLAGQPCDMTRIWDIARRYHLLVVEDAAHAVGTIYENRMIGEAAMQPRLGSDAVAYSFYASKNLTTAEGGMVTTADPALHDRMKCLCLHGISHDAWNRYTNAGSWYYEVNFSGFKYNLSDLQSSLGIHQLKKQEEFIKIRQRHARMYSEILANMPEVDLPAEAPPRARHSWHLYSIRLNLAELTVDRATCIQALHAAGIGCSVHFIPIPLHSFFREYAQRPENRCPVALEFYPRLISLPIYPSLSEAQVEKVGKDFRSILERCSVGRFHGLHPPASTIPSLATC